MFFVGEKNFTSKTINVYASKWEFTKKHAWLFAIFSCVQSFLFYNIVFSSCFISKNVNSLQMIEVVDCK